MALLLHIDTSTPVGSVCLSENGKILSERISTEQKDHASVVAPFIKEILEETEVKKSQIDAISISCGPGSYTGLRVATSTAKGLCFAWNIPLIAISTLKMMAYGIRQELHEASDVFICPMIDARRMEVFMALYDSQLKEIIPPKAAILEDDFLQEYKDKRIVIAGTGQPKAERIMGINTKLTYLPYICKASHLVELAEEAFQTQKFEDVAYFDPFYLKSVYLPTKNKSRKTNSSLID